MPRYAEISKYLLILWYSFVAVGVAFSSLWLQRWESLIYAIPPLAAAVGLNRNLRWGYRIAVYLQVITLFAWFIGTIPESANPRTFGHTFYELAAWLQVTIYVLASTVMLLPLVVIDRNIKSFRSETW
jgi:hypothetical protein